MDWIQIDNVIPKVLIVLATLTVGYVVYLITKELKKNPQLKSKK